MIIKIYQINNSRDKKNIRFFNSDFLKKQQGEFTVDSTIYDKIFSDNVDCKTLEDVFEKFNTELPENYYGRSLSVSDIVEVVEDNEIEKGFYFCDTFGFKKVEFEPSLTEDIVDKNKINVLYVQANKYPKVVRISNTLEEMQKLVGGYIELMYPFDDEVALVCNDEGKMNGLPLNRAIYDDDSKQIVDIIAGDFFIAYAPSNSENFKSLPKALEKKYQQKFKYAEYFYKLNDKIKVCRLAPKDYLSQLYN